MNRNSKWDTQPPNIIKANDYGLLTNEIASIRISDKQQKALIRMAQVQDFALIRVMDICDGRVK